MVMGAGTSGVWRECRTAPNKGVAAEGEQRGGGQQPDVREVEVAV
jgi:hypothetical protein